MQYTILVQLKALDTEASYNIQHNLVDTLVPDTTTAVGGGKIYTWGRRLANGDTASFSSADLRLADIKHIQLVATGPVLISLAEGTPFQVTYMAWDYPSSNTSGLAFTLSLPPNSTPVDARVSILGRESPYIVV